MHSILRIEKVNCVGAAGEEALKQRSVIQAGLKREKGGKRLEKREKMT